MDAPEDLKSRTKRFALRIIRLYGKLPNTTEGQVIGKQIIHSGTSVGAHYREASRARSIAKFISKVEGGLQELKETSYWLELLSESGIMSGRKLSELMDEANQLTAILVTCTKNAKVKRKN